MTSERCPPTKPEHARAPASIIFQSRNTEKKIKRSSQLTKLWLLLMSSSKFLTSPNKSLRGVQWAFEALNKKRTRKVTERKE